MNAEANWFSENGHLITTIGRVAYDAYKCLFSLKASSTITEQENFNMLATKNDPSSKKTITTLPVRPCAITPGIRCANTDPTKPTALQTKNAECNASPWYLCYVRAQWSQIANTPITICFCMHVMNNHTVNQECHNGHQVYNQPHRKPKQDQNKSHIGFFFYAFDYHSWLKLEYMLVYIRSGAT